MLPGLNGLGQAVAMHFCHGQNNTPSSLIPVWLIWYLTGLMGVIGLCQNAMEVAEALISAWDLIEHCFFQVQRIQPSCIF